MDNYGIQIASQLSGIGVHTIRKWEQRYGAVNPRRDDNGRRLYSEKDIEKLQLLFELCSIGHTIGKIADLEVVELKSLLKKIGRKKFDSPKKVDLTPNINPEEVRRNLFLALELYKLDIISHELSKLKIISSNKTLVLDIISPLLKEVGVKILNGQISLGQELALFSILKFHLGQIIFKSYEQKFKKPNVVIFATPEGEPYELEILLGSILCSHYGINSFYLGTGLPLDSLVEAAKSLNADTIVLGTNELLRGREKQKDLFFSRLINRTKGKIKVCALGGTERNWKNLLNESSFSFFPSISKLDSFLQKL
jgi:DNA-binding transcriptional MerR regulator